MTRPAGNVIIEPPARTLRTKKRPVICIPYMPAPAPTLSARTPEKLWGL